jgi:hypothetical protein
MMSSYIVYIFIPVESTDPIEDLKEVLERMEFAPLLQPIYTYICVYIQIYI